jgi:hypothetical protein
VHPPTEFVLQHSVDLVRLHLSLLFSESKSDRGNVVSTTPSSSGYRIEFDLGAVVLDGRLATVRDIPIVPFDDVVVVQILVLTDDRPRWRAQR